jgi:hypothetical protein
MTTSIKVKLSLQQAMDTHRVCETSRLQHFLDNQLRDGSEVVSLTNLPSITPSPQVIPGAAGN